MGSSLGKIPGSNFLSLLDLRIIEAQGWKDRPLQFLHSILRYASPPGPACMLVLMDAHYLLGHPYGLWKMN